MGTKEETIKQLEEDIKKKQKELESPFDIVGAATPTKPRGRPPKTATADASPDAAVIAHSQRMNEITRPPPNSSSESVRDWAEKEIHNLLPEAVASLAWDIKFGDAKARTEARGEILRATGIDKRDAANFGKGGQIVINVAGAANGISLPYLNRSNQEPAKPLVATIEVDKKGKE